MGEAALVRVLVALVATLGSLLLIKLLLPLQATTVVQENDILEDDELD